MERVGVCSWSLQAGSVPELQRLLAQVGTDLVHVGCGDPEHGIWEEGDALPRAIRAAGIRVAGAMVAFAGEDYTTPATIERTGGFADRTTRAARLERLRWAVAMTRELGTTTLTLHGGTIPPAGDARRDEILDVLARAAAIAARAGVVLCLETGQDPAERLAAALADVGAPNLRVNFDPANLIAYGTGDALAALATLAPHVAGVHMKDALAPAAPGAWGREVPLGSGAVDVPGLLRGLARVGYAGPVCVEREVGTQAERVADVAAAIAYLRELQDPRPLAHHHHERT
jgi:L-ribulose-5-phosphate 3-epimerase